MLQQTTVAAAAPFYERWMARFPTLESLARADEEDVLHLWSGLGYYNRAKNLHQAAQIVAAEHGGELPQELSELLLLPGIGRYTAGAIASIAFGKRVPAVDVNISRVLARLDALREPITSAIAQEIVWEEAAALAKTSNPGDLNQALMELGALICSPTAPDCPSCPVRPLCRAAERGDPERYPTRPARPQVVEVTEVGAAIERDGRWLFLRRQEGARMAGMWEIPHSPVRGEKPATAVAPLVRALTGLNVAIEEHLATISHTFTHHHVTLHVWRASAPTEGRVRRQQHAAHQWATLDQIARRPMSTPQRRVVAALREAAQGRQLDLLASAHSVGPAGFG
jgi:A/G-specific adenine glycosylase